MSNFEKHKARLAANWSEVFPAGAARPVSPKPSITPMKKASRQKSLKLDASVVNMSGSMEKLKGLSLRQPWAEQVIRGEKTVEYRQRQVKYRGRVYIYASNTRYPADDEEDFASEVGYEINNLPRGVIVGTVEITDCIEEDEGEFAWQLANPQRLDPPIPPIERAQPIWFHPFGRPDE